MKPLIPRRDLLIQSTTILAFPSVMWACAADDTAALVRQPRSRVAVVRKEGVLQADHSLQAEPLADMLDAGMRAALDRKTVLDSWKALFSSTDVVGIKLNTLGGPRLSPHPELVRIIAQRLVEAGVAPQRILIWDRFERELTKAGFPPGDFHGVGIVVATDTARVGYDAEPQISGSIGSCFSRIISTFCTALINVGVLKDHDLSGTSVAMKNLFGLIHNPNRYHFDVHADPYLPDLCLHPFVKDKLRLTICDGFLAQYDGGPAYKSQRTWAYGGLLVSRDPVALDAVAATVLSQKRREENLPSFAEAGREPKYIALAEDKRLGWADPGKIDCIEV